ncbi:signal transduction histidine kinase [Agrilactobacillus composti DSM 18527 = JCM 14202]|nr:HAMP domain-containing sensor histidine kinase [Agrilactobacillus composti]GAF40117.1 signal transduction histidine kinase [Agrilactobacillus composti DSM 18527 = JCM 14202]
MKMKNQSSAAIMLRHLMAMVVFITLSLGMLIVIAVGHQLLEEVTITSAHTMTSLKKTDIDSDNDWDTWRKNSTLDTSSSYISIYNMRADAKVKHYYSPNTVKLLASKPVAVPLIRNLYYRPDKGLFFHQMVHARGIKYELWQSVQNQMAILGRVLTVTILLLILTLFVSPFYIRRLTHKLTDSLRTLSQSTQTIITADQPDTDATQLPVPKYPTEVTDLATSFNALLAQLHQRQEQQKSFVMNAAHELRTPIATIRSHAQLIERHAAEHPEIVPKSVTYIIDESRQMQQLIDELLQLSHADQLPLQTQRFNLSTTLDDLLQQLNPTIVQTITSAIAPAIFIDGNAAALVQIVDNLITNAAKYSPENSTIHVTLKQAGPDQVSLAVADQGRGIDSKDRAHIFERFYRSADVRGAVPGTGLGLAIADQLAKMSHGHFEITANHPQGTIIQLILTLQQPTTTAQKTD